MLPILRIIICKTKPYPTFGRIGAWFPAGVDFPEPHNDDAAQFRGGKMNAAKRLSAGITLKIEGRVMKNKTLAVVLALVAIFMYVSIFLKIGG